MSEASLSIDEIKQYNAELNKRKEESARLTAEINFNKEELVRKCAELTKALGREVNPDNIEEIHKEYVESLRNKLDKGKAVLNKISTGEISGVNGAGEAITMTPNEEAVQYRQASNAAMGVNVGTVNTPSMEQQQQIMQNQQMMEQQLRQQQAMAQQNMNQQAVNQMGAFITQGQPVFNTGNNGGFHI